MISAVPTSRLRPFGPAWLRPSRPLGTQAVWPTQHCIRFCLIFVMCIFCLIFSFSMFFSSPTWLIHSFIHYIELWHNLFHLSITYLPDLPTSMTSMTSTTVFRIYDLWYLSWFPRYPHGWFWMESQWTVFVTRMVQEWRVIGYSSSRMPNICLNICLRNFSEILVPTIWFCRDVSSWTI